jgi:ADP-ribose pyrophosphatase
MIQFSRNGRGIDYRREGDQEMQPWKTIEKRKLMDGHPWLQVWAEDVRLPSGEVVEGFYTLDMPDYVVVVAQAPDGRILTERSYKHGPRRVCLNVPGGYIHNSEHPLATAQRELLEETGYSAQNWVELGSFTNDANRGSGVGHLFLARELLREGEPDSGDLEEMQIDLMSPDELMGALRGGEVQVLSNAAAIALALLHH